MKLKLLSEKRNGDVLFRTYSCPCGKGFVEEEQDHTIGHRDASVVIRCNFCKTHYSIIYINGSLNWRLYHDYTTYYKKSS